jgi:DNA-directed RNA polymerase specialized sigma24 family protein
VPDDALGEATLARARAGDEEAFRELTDPHRRELQLHCYRILGSMQDAEDLVQETLLAAWRGSRRSRAEPPCGPGSTGSRPTAA